jgi:hypothetical protein
MRKLFMAPIATLALAAAAPTAHAATTISSTFDTGAEGWTFGSYLGFGGIGVTWDSASQAIVKPNHGFGDFGFIASSAYLGDKSDFLNGTFSFDLAASAPSAQYADRPPLVLTGANGKVIFADSLGLPSPGFTTFSIKLNASSFYSGSPTGTRTNVSASQFEAILADLEQVQVWGDWSPSVETARLDNVAMAANAGVPEPATWALMIMGFGGAGAALRRRRVAVAAI